MQKVTHRCSVNGPTAILRARYRWTAALLVFLVCNLQLAWGQNPGIEPEAQPVASLADALRHADKNIQVHILYVHGMSDDGPGYSDSAVLRKSICKFLRDCTAPEGQFERRDYANKDKFVLDAPTPPLSYLGEQIWKSRQGGSLSEGWNAAAPFVDHWKLVRRRASAIYIDEINWWPLVFAVKCRQIVASDAEFVGPSKKYIAKCARLEKDATNAGRFLSYSWIEPAEAQRLEALPARGAYINRTLKNYVLDWGFTDAVLAVGQMRPYLLEGIRELILESVNVATDGSRGDEVVRSPNQEFVIVSHSLGSYLILSALDVDLAESDTSKLREWKIEFEEVLSHTSIVYFFANQLRLLELANLDNNTGANMICHLEVWGRLRGAHQDSATRPELVAWSDPSDLLSWNVPELHSVLVKNRYVRNSPHWLWLLENPASAHGNYDVNKSVLRAEFSSPGTGSSRVQLVCNRVQKPGRCYRMEVRIGQRNRCSWLVAAVVVLEMLAKEFAGWEFRLTVRGSPFRHALASAHSDCKFGNCSQ